LHITDLKSLESDTIIDADIIIIGGGAAGITLARELFGQNLSVVILESGGLTETSENERLNAVEITDEPNTPAQIAKRRQFHADLTRFWSHEVQPFGVCCRVLGGATAAWAGKSAPFDLIDFAKRPWIANSGWPIARESLEPYIERATERLNLGPAINDDALWGRIGVTPDNALSRMEALRSFFWQFARSRIDPLDIMRFGPEFALEHADNVRVFTHATVSELHVDAKGTGFSHADVIASDGSAKATVRAPVAVVAASAIENARLLLASRSRFAEGLGNAHDNVGRYLMDHPGARVASFPKKDVPRVYKPFSFFALTENQKTSMYMHGMALNPDVQAQDKTLNCAFYMLEDRSPDDPWDAIKRLLKRKSRAPLADIVSIVTSPGMLVTGIGRKILQSPKIPGFLKMRIVDMAIVFNPNFAVREFQSGGLPHKLQGVHVDVITEQPPLRDNRITLSDQLNPLGRPLARITWQVGTEAKAAIAHMARTISAEFVKAGLPQPKLESWVERNALDEAVIIDMAHTAGTTRISDDPATGVVDTNCMVHGVEGLYVMGASVFPTSGHANPTLMIVAMAIRLADQLKNPGQVHRSTYVDTGAPSLF